MSGGEYKIGRFIGAEVLPTQREVGGECFYFIKVNICTPYRRAVSVRFFFFLQENDAKSVSSPMLTLRMPLQNESWVAVLPLARETEWTF